MNHVHFALKKNNYSRYHQLETSKNLTDDFPVCKLSGVGFSTNQIYREDGNRQEEHEFEDAGFHYKLQENKYLYGVLDGHEGRECVDFCLQRIAAEFVTDINREMSDEEVKEKLR